jgi:hypothetical protein
MKSLKALDRTVSSNKQRWINGERDGFRLKGRKVSRRTFSRHVKVPDAWKTAARSKGHVNGGKKKTP